MAVNTWDQHKAATSRTRGFGRHLGLFGLEGHGEDHPRQDHT